MDTNILLSLVNMKLRDGEEPLEDIASALDMTREELETTLAAAGYFFDEAQRRFC